MSKGGAPQSNTDWDSVTVLSKKTPRASELRTAKAVNEAQRTGGEIDTMKKFTASSNRQHTAAKNTAQLDAETEDFHHDHIGIDVARLIQQGRQAKSFTQKDLAQRINEKQTVINEYESGKAIPNAQIMSKLERALGIRLRGKEAGKPFPAK